MCFDVRRKWSSYKFLIVYRSYIIRFSQQRCGFWLIFSLFGQLHRAAGSEWVQQRNQSKFHIKPNQVIHLSSLLSHAITLTENNRGNGSNICECRLDPPSSPMWAIYQWSKPQWIDWHVQFFSEKNEKLQKNKLCVWSICVHNPGLTFPCLQEGWCSDTF